MSEPTLFFFDYVLTILAFLASVTNFATYRSRSIDQGALVDNVRAIKAAAWGVVTVYMVAMIWDTGHAPLSGLALIVLWMLAFSDIVAALARIGDRLQTERAEAAEAYRPPTVVNHR